MLKQNAKIPVIAPKTIPKLKNIMQNIKNQPNDINRHYIIKYSADKWEMISTVLSLKLSHKKELFRVKLNYKKILNSINYPSKKLEI